MSMELRSHRGSVRAWDRWICVGLGLILSGLMSCSGSSGSSTPAPITQDPPTGPTIPTELQPEQDLPGLVVQIAELSGGSGPNGNFQTGDFMSVTFNMRLDDGTLVTLDQVDFGGILVSGPTSNYQRVLGYQRDLLTKAVYVGNDLYRYTFADPIPATYLPPLNDTPSIGAEDGEMTGQPLVAGTYTVGIEAYKMYTVEGEEFRDAGNTTQDFLMGNATGLEPREVVTIGNCNQCHTELRAHGTIRRDVRHCVLCHTAGAEDKNVATAAGGTPGASIDFRVMIHKIHNAAHLPSVLGVETKSDGTRKYDATPKPYQLVGFRDSVHDFSEVAFPVWPYPSNPMPRDFGYSNLSSTEKGLENAIRSGAAGCAKCHGDPDGAGPLAAPAQGHHAFSNPTRAACGSCHDDVDWTKPYRSNLAIMPPQPTNAVCTKCHPASGGLLGTEEAHMHPLLNPQLNAGLVFNVTKVLESGQHNNDGTLDPGEKVRVQFTIKDSNGKDVDPKGLGRMEVVVSGPTNNRNIMLEERFPTALLTTSNVDTHLPQKLFLEHTGDSSATLGDKFTTLRTPHWTGTTTVFVRSTTQAAASSLTAACNALQNYVDVLDVTGLARGDYIVLDEGKNNEEYLRIQYIDGKRLWFSSTHSPYDQPCARFAHPNGASVSKVTLVKKTVSVDYSLDPVTGTITELKEFGTDAAVVVSYTSDFVIPEVYPVALNESPGLDQSSGKWTGLKILDGTYTVGIWGEKDIVVKVADETNTYHGTSRAGVKDFLVGNATTIEPAQLISSAANCTSCHNDIMFHGSHRRGFDTCIMCHGTAGSEDRPQYVAANAPPTTGVTIDFRTMLHKIHKGKDLANASTYAVVGFGSGYPNNYTAHTYEHVGFPVMVGGVKNCVACHGANNQAWMLPAPRVHPQQTKPTQEWYATCGSCHDSKEEQAHIAAQTSAKGAESCKICHGKDQKWPVELMHKVR